jgi:predicted ATPase
MEVVMLEREMRLLDNKWKSNQGWAKRLDSIEIKGIRGWDGEKVYLKFPMVAIVGENGIGKSTILQAIASIYKSTPTSKTFYASDFFPDTAWETIENAFIGYTLREGKDVYNHSVRKHSKRWRGNPERRMRPVVYVDLRRTQPISAQVGYWKIADPSCIEIESVSFEDDKLKRFCSITGRKYESARLGLTNADSKRKVPILESGEVHYSGFHQGAGEMVLVELLKTDFPANGIVLIDELETSLHPRCQRRLIRDLADVCRTKELQIIFTTHSPYILEELPEEGRIYVMNTKTGRAIITGVSPDFAMTKMDDELHPEIDLYVEDSNAKIMLEEIISETNKDYLLQCAIIPYGASSVGVSLGQMVSGKRFPRNSLVFLDGDQERAPGCLIMPGKDAPERVVFQELRNIGWQEVSNRIGRSHSDTVDALEHAMTLANHHDWIKSAADRLVVGGGHLWRGMCNCWAQKTLTKEDKDFIIRYIESTLQGIDFKEPENNIIESLPTAPVKPRPKLLFD